MTGQTTSPGINETLVLVGKKRVLERLHKAIEIIRTTKRASTSNLQRKLSIGYNRAARIMEMLEKDGIVGQANHVGKREIL